MDLVSLLANQMHSGLSRLSQNPKNIRYAEVQLFNASTIAILAPAVFRLFTLAVPTRRDLVICLLGYLGRHVFKTALFNNAENTSAQAYRAAEGAASIVQESMEVVGINTESLFNSVSQMAGQWGGVKTPTAKELQKGAQSQAMRNFNPSKEYKRVDLKGYHLFWIRQDPPTQRPSGNPSRRRPTNTR